MAITCCRRYHGNTSITYKQQTQKPLLNRHFHYKFVLKKMYNFDECLLIETMPRNIGLNKSDQFTAIYTNSTQCFFVNV